MPLVDYADSDDSEVEDKPVAERASGKPVFQKVVDRTNPHKIRVSLPEFSKDAPTAGEGEERRPAKRPKMSIGESSGFNSFLPAPKRAPAANGDSANGLRRGGLSSGFSLKTGATPGFSREVDPIIDGFSGDIEEVAKEGFENGSVTEGAVDAELAAVRGEKAPEILDNESTKQKNAVMFKPLSVARKARGKKTISPAFVGPHATRETPFLDPSKAISKASLFSTVDSQESQLSIGTQKGEYTPMIYQAYDATTKQLLPERGIDLYHEDTVIREDSLPQASASPSDFPQFLSTIAADLKLSASAKRQLFGRQGNNASAISIVNFNTDQEYAANEVLRQNGEQVQHNPVRALAAGKHSLKQLVNAASNQKDALEEQFASGRRNKKEAGSKYGW